MTIEIAYDQIPQGPASGNRFRVLATKPFNNDVVFSAISEGEKVATFYSVPRSVITSGWDNCLYAPELTRLPTKALIEAFANNQLLDCKNFAI